MSSNLGANRIFMLDVLDHGLALQALADGFSLDAVSNGLNISKLELMTMLTPHAPLSNLLLVPALELEPLCNSTLVPVHLHNQIRQVPASGSTPTADSFQETEDPMDLQFKIMFWACISIVTIIVFLALGTKFKMAVNDGWERMEQRLETEGPKDDLERWCLRRKFKRELEAKKKKLVMLQMEIKELENAITGRAEE